MRRHLTSLLVIAFLAVGCGGDNDQNPGTPTPDTGTTAPEADAGTTLPPEQDASTEPACDYPTGPYGTETGDMVENFEFEGYADPDYLCKPAAALKMDLSTKRTLSFKDYYCNSTCPDQKRRLLWVIVSAGWCGPCQEEVAATQAQFEQGAIDPRVHLINLIYETDKATPITEEFTQLWAENNLFTLSFPIGMDPTFRMAAYFDRDAVPFNMLVDLETMRIIFRQTGSNLPAVGQALHNYLLDK